MGLVATAVVSAVLVTAAAATAASRLEDVPDPAARRLHTRALVVDTHDDTPQRMVFQGFDLGARDTRGHVDIPRMREGGLDAVFFSIWVPSKVTGPVAVKRALGQIDAVREQVRRHSRDLELAQINYEITFLSQEARSAKQAGGRSVELDDAELQKMCGEDEACQILEGERRDRQAMEAGTLPRVGYEKIVDHIDHAVRVAGVDHVGLGSDFDGASMPFGMEDCSKLPRLTAALLARGYSEADVLKILGGNLLRVLERSETVARDLAASAAGARLP